LISRAALEIENRGVTMPQVDRGTLIVGVLMALILLFGLLDTIGIIHV
jgi:hypothetical protein